MFNNAPVIRAEFGDGVFCLAGANGLGKSTFLAALNFAITGIVADPNRRFSSVPEYYRYSQPRSAEFFRGRISEKDRDLAEIELVMDVADHRYRLVRGMFEPIGLRQLSITSLNGSEVRATEDHDDATIDSAERHNVYTRAVTTDAGVQSFAQLVFLQLFVFTFDESRQLLFWNDDISQNALFMAFGMDFERAGRADTLRRNYEKADSLAKNLQWQATDIRKRMEDVQASLDHGNTDQSADIGETHQQMLADREAVASDLSRLEVELRDARLRVAEQSAQREALRDEYERAFRKVLLGRNPPTAHPVVSESLQSSICSICGTDSPAVARNIREQLDRGHCPLCRSEVSLSESTDREAQEELKSLDNAIAERDAEIMVWSQAVTRLSDQTDQLQTRMRNISGQIAQFEYANDSVLLGTSPVTAVQGILNQYRAQITELLERKEIEVEKRSDARRELRSLQEDLARAYAEGEQVFVPRFTLLAREFLGLDLDVKFETVNNKVRLVLNIMNNPRNAPDTLSESQRFFVDIALRMALAQHISAPGEFGTLYIDTPEGSLDIAYESRAGKMFGTFVERGHQLIMTANINTSQLLLKLAETCGSQHMKLLRMTEWTSLSDVQVAAEDMFDQAYNAIEAALESGGE